MWVPVPPRATRSATILPGGGRHANNNDALREPVWRQIEMRVSCWCLPSRRWSDMRYWVSPELLLKHSPEYAFRLRARQLRRPPTARILRWRQGFRARCPHLGALLNAEPVRRGSSCVHPGETRCRYRSPHRRVPRLWAYPSWSRRSVAPRRSRVWFGMQPPPEFPPVSGVRDPRPILGAHRADTPPAGWHGGWLRRRTRRTGNCPVSPIVRNTVAPPLRNAYPSWEIRCHQRSMPKSAPESASSAGHNPEPPSSPRHHSKMPWQQSDAGIGVWHLLGPEQVVPPWVRHFCAQQATTGPCNTPGKVPPCLHDPTQWTAFPHTHETWPRYWVRVHLSCTQHRHSLLLLQLFYDTVILDKDPAANRRIAASLWR